MYTKKQLISSLKEGDRVEDIFVVKIKKAITPYQNGFRFQLILSDSSGKSIEYTYWGGNDEDEVKNVFDSIKEDYVVEVKGWFKVFGKKPQISTNPPDTINALKEGEYDISDFIKPAKRPIEEMVNELNEQINSIQNTDIKAILNEVFTENQDFLNKFKTHPGAIEIHHNWTGGLLQHTLEVAKICEVSRGLFPELDRDLVIAGALLHDIGKLHELGVTTRIKGTIKGQLKGHIPMGFKMLSDVMDRLKTEEMTRSKLLHIVLSHHGFNEFGSPKEPMFSEALAVYYADELSSKLTEITEFVKDSKEATENDFMYNRRHSRNILLR